MSSAVGCRPNTAPRQIRMQPTYFHVFRLQQQLIGLQQLDIILLQYSMTARSICSLDSQD
jgi:hypothetical protein